MTDSFTLLQHPKTKFPFFAETDASETASDNSCSAFEALQVHGAVQSTHQSLAQGRLPPRA